MKVNIRLEITFDKQELNFRHTLGLNNIQINVIKCLFRGKIMNHIGKLK
jgi:hypothetical protein